SPCIARVAPRIDVSFERYECEVSPASEIYPLSLHDALPISRGPIDPREFEKRTLEELGMPQEIVMRHRPQHFLHLFSGDSYSARSEEHTSELQSRENLVCRLLLEKKNNSVRRKRIASFTMHTRLAAGLKQKSAEFELGKL